LNFCNGALYFCKRASNFRKRALYCRKSALYSRNGASIPAKEPYVSAKEPYISAKEPYICSAFQRKSPVSQQRSPIHWQNVFCAEHVLVYQEVIMTTRHIGRTCSVMPRAFVILETQQQNMFRHTQKSWLDSWVVLDILAEGVP